MLTCLHQPTPTSELPVIRPVYSERVGTFSLNRADVDGAGYTSAKVIDSHKLI